ncbi:MAG: glucose-6-phosphate isomerase [Microbacterium sp. 14-71-5]|uniref:glucose-6-phosphate isomerase n=1 Tax=Microbacterium sp. 13-71-7 TaxID=1970399 RepID=UPI000BDBE6CC|nr:glucose-6-phosphate isomerase [Microbacterium sp. 13-71-7]OZB83297.1 MAG: glucose-6-phosphate isomerase [Microbacterium sp. 13-71-7]OZB88884.1 MAG: glucose-6-phosphate isomerase [Microbacterium sp. 14-71-5]
MSFEIHTSGAPKAAIDEVVPRLVGELIASRITGGDPTVWGEAAEAEASIRLGWVDAVSVSRPLVPEILALRDELAGKGVTRVVLAGMGGSSLAPEVISQTAGIDVTILDSTSPGQVLAAIDAGLADAVLVVSSKSGSTVETDSQRRTFEAAFRDVGIDPVERIVVVTDPGSPLDESARAAGYRVFNADPNVGGRYSALTAFGLVPSGLAGVDISELLDEAEATLLQVAIDSAENPALLLGAAIAASAQTPGGPRRDKLGLITDGTHIVGLPDWIEQLVAESTGKEGTGILPVVLLPVSPEVDARPADLQLVRLVDEADEFHLRERHPEEILVSGTLGAQFVVWEYATAIAGYLLGINPFDQPDVESAKIAARGLLDARPEAAPAAFEQDGVEVRASDASLLASGTIAGVLDALWRTLPADGYVSIQAYVNRLEMPQLQGLRELVAADSGRPTTFGWGPRFLHSTGQYHKGGPAQGVFLQILERTDVDLEIPDRPFTFGQLIEAQAAGDAGVLAAHGRPVVTLTITEPQDDVLDLFEAAQ